MPQPTQTLTDVVNIALSLLGHKPIQNIETPGRSLEAFLQGVVVSAIRSVQADYVWQELVVVTTLNREADPTADGFNQFPMPTNLLRIVKLSSEAAYSRRGNRLLSKADEVTLHYVAYNDDPGDWSEYLTEAVYTEMAARLAMPLTQKSSLAAELKQLSFMNRKLLPAKAERESRSAQMTTRGNEYVSTLRGTSVLRDNRFEAR